MAKRTSALAPSNNSDALFRAWINEIHNSLIAFGWTQTSDTGQINFSTVTRPTAINTYQGYAVYTMGDSMQATCPLYLRFDFGTGGVADDPAIKFQAQIGATDGAGNLSAAVMSVVTTSPSGASASATTLVCRTSGTSSAFRMSFWLGQGTGISHGWHFAIERDKDSSGSDTALGVNLVWIYNSNNVTTAVGVGSQFLGVDGGSSAADTGRIFTMVAGVNNSGNLNTKSVGPVHTNAGGFRNAMTGLLVTNRADWSNDSTNSVFIYGAIHTYLFQRTGNNTIGVNQWNSDSGGAILWE
jgi:hypothetical protein